MEGKYHRQLGNYNSCPKSPPSRGGLGEVVHGLTYLPDIYFPLDRFDVFVTENHSLGFPASLLVLVLFLFLKINHGISQGGRRLLAR